ncbi:MAG: ATP-grasp domain-containing protein [Sciscionella sp.]
MRKNVFVLGLDEHNQRILDDMPDADSYTFHPLLSFEEIYGEEIELAPLLAKARQHLSSFDGRIDAIIGFWDFPVSTMLPILRQRFGLAGATLEEVVKCEHKYWSRLEQQKVIEEYPRFGLVDLEATDLPEGLSYPVWLKPVKSFSSVLAFGVHDRVQFADAVKQIREGISWVGEPFDELLEYLDLPAEIAEVGGQACLAEEALTGQMATVEGYRCDGEVHIYGVVDSVRYPNSSSFLRYQYPSSLPTEVCLRMAEIGRTVISAIGLERMTFNIEFFWDSLTDSINLLEINPRHSQSHAELFEDVDGMANHEVMLQLALGNTPVLPHRQGRFNYAAKWFLRRFSDGIVTHHPTPEEIERVTELVPGTSVDLSVHTGDRLSELHEQDSYSYSLANIYVGASDENELQAKFERVAEELPFGIEDVEA